MRKKKIKILHVAQAAGGVDRYIRMLLKYLDKEKFENILVCSQDFNREDYDGLVDSFEQIEMNRAIGVSDLNSIKEVRRLIKKYNPDIVYAHSSKAGAIARVADIGLKNHCVYNPHGWAFNMRCSDKKRAMYTAIEKMAAPFCEKIICISDAEKQSALEKKICREDKLQVIFNGVDIEAYESGEHGTVKRSSLGIPEDAYVVGMVGRISPQKAPDVFVKMAKLVKDEIPNAHFVIVGSGNQEAEIRKYAEENKFADSLHITGWVDDPMSYVELFDVACLLSRWEGFGLALPEYMMAGKPIVASRVDAIPNIIRNGENGLLVEVDDATGASEAVLQIYRDRSLKDKLVSKGVEDVHNRFDAQRVSEEHGILFENMWKVETMHIRAAFIIASEAIYSPSAEYKRVPDKIINKAKQWSEQYPKKIEFQEAYFGLLFSRLKYAQAQDMRNEQRRVYREMKTVAERANYSEYNESNQLMESVDILHRVFGY